MKKQKIIISLAIVIIIIVGSLLSFNLLKNNEKIYVKLNEKFTLNKNEAVYFKTDNKDIKIKLNKIVDNTCPMDKDAQCIWEGEYIVNITVANNSYKMGTLSPSDRIYTLNIKGTIYNINLDAERNKKKATFTIVKEDEELIDSDISEMEEVNNHISNIQNSDSYKKLSISEKVSYMETELNKLATIGTERFKKPLIKKESIHSEDNQYSVMISFEYSSGALGGIMITESNLTYTIENNLDDYNSKYSEKGVYYDTLNRPDAPSFYTIAMGKQNTGGYSLQIEKVNIDEKENVEVIVKENKPAPGDIVTEAITYPVVQITFNKSPGNIIFKNTEGQIFKHMNF